MDTTAGKSSHETQKSTEGTAAPVVKAAAWDSNTNNITTGGEQKNTATTTDIKLLRLPDVCIAFILQYVSDDDVTLRNLAMAVGRHDPQTVRRIIDTLHARETSKRNIRLKADTLGELFSKNVESKLLAWPSFEAANLCSLNRSIGAAARAKNVAATFADGRLRDVPVFIRGGAHQPPPAKLVNKLVDQYTKYIKAWLVTLRSHFTQRYHGHTPTARKASCSVDLAFLVGFAFWRLTWIHPFMDGNGRTAHLMAWAVADEMTGILATHRRRASRYGSGESAAAAATTTATGAASADIMENWMKTHANAVENVQFLEHRRSEERALLMEALHAADDGWAAASMQEKKRWLSPPNRLSPSNPAPSTVPYPPWYEVGLLLLQTVWVFDPSHFESQTILVKKKAYRWVNDMGGGDYSTGITESNCSVGNSKITGTTTVSSTSQQVRKYKIDQEKALLAWHGHVVLYDL